jgi:hypothetical protein
LQTLSQLEAWQQSQRKIPGKADIFTIYRSQEIERTGKRCPTSLLSTREVNKEITQGSSATITGLTFATETMYQP